MKSHPNFLSKEDENEVVAAIKNAELQTSGEIRVHIENGKTDDAYFRAIEIFEKLGMHNTVEKNGVLIYISFEKKKFAIIGDSGINKKVPAGFWDNTAEIMKKYFANNNVAKGITTAVTMAGEHLAKYFPRKNSDKNELDDSVSY